MRSVYRIGRDIIKETAMRVLYRFDFRSRDGHLSGLFIADQDYIESRKDVRCYAEDMLGKGSRLFGKVGDNLTVFSIDPDLIKQLEAALGFNHDVLPELPAFITVVGFNPLNYMVKKQAHLA